MMNLQTTPMDFAGLSATMFQWPDDDAFCSPFGLAVDDFAILTYPYLGEPSYTVHHGHEQIRFIAYADALDYITMLALGGCLAVKASPAPAYAYRNAW